MHILSAEQFTRGGLEAIFESTDKLRSDHAQDPRLLAERHWGKQIITTFYEPSTRTRISFEIGAAKLGIIPISTENAKEFSSAAKGETVEDTVRVFEQYLPAAIVMRHDQEGSVRRAAEATSIPVINAGDGPGEHPTQALLDAYTINSQRGSIDGAHIVMGGDLRHGRTARSLAKMLRLFNDVHITFASIDELQMKDDITAYLDVNGVKWDQTDDLTSVVGRADVFYWTRLQDERFKVNDNDTKEERTAKLELATKVAESQDNLTIDLPTAEAMPGTSFIMHPLPRRGEIKTEVDLSERAHYFPQAGNGMWVRMALLDTIVSEGN